MSGRKTGTAVQATRVLMLYKMMVRRTKVGVSTAEIAHRFDTTQRQAARDIDVVASVFPVTWDKKNHRYYLTGRRSRAAS